MITQAKFENGMALLQTHFNRELCPSVIAIWSEYLNEHLDDDSFTLAVKEAIIGLDFFPSAKKLVEFATATKEVTAIADWQIILSAARTSNEQWQQQILQPLKERSRIALAVIGGLSSIALADDWQLGKMEKQFITVYCDAPSGMKLLPPAPISQSQFEVVETQTSSAPIDLSAKPSSIRRLIENLNLRSQGVEIPIKQVYANTFARYGWEIDEHRLNYFLAMDEDQKQQFLAKFRFSMRNKSHWRSAVSIFDDISGYKTTQPHLDSKAIARQWLTEQQSEQILENF